MKLSNKKVVLNQYPNAEVTKEWRFALCSKKRVFLININNNLNVGVGSTEAEAWKDAKEKIQEMVNKTQKATQD